MQAMRHLTLSLVLAVITATFGLGWLLSQINHHIDKSAQVPPPILAYQALAVDLAMTLDKLADKQTFIDNWTQQATLPLTLQNKSDFPLPMSLAAEFFRGEPLLLEADGIVSVYVYMPQSELILGIDMHSSEAVATHTSLDWLLTFGFYFGLTLVIAIWLYPLVKDLNRLRGAARQFGEGKLSTRAEVKPHSYIADIIAEFNAMAERIQRLVNDNKLLSRAVSHDLKTPLARLRFGIGTLAEEQSEQLRQKYVDRINHDLDNMETLVATLLDYARLDEANIELQLQKIELNDFVAKLMQPYTQADCTITLSSSATPLVILADPRYLAMQINNILDNALQYAQSQILITLSSANNSYMLCIEDDGPGFPADNYQRLLQPFQRGEFQRSDVQNKPIQQTEAHHGMGLAISDKIAQWFRARLVLGASANLSGARVELHYATAANTKPAAGTS